MPVIQIPPEARESLVRDSRISILNFKLILTKAERIRIRAAAKVSDAVADFVDLLSSATFVDMERRDTVEAVAQLGAAELLDHPSRVNEIIATRIPREVLDYNGTLISKLALKQRLTKAERIRIRNAAKNSDDVFDAQDLLDSAEYVDLSRKDLSELIHGLTPLLDHADRPLELLSLQIKDQERYKGAAWF